MPLEMPSFLAPEPPSGPLVRPLTEAEIAVEVAPDYAATGNALPNPAVSKFLGVFDGDKLLGYICIQAKLHAQPLVLRPGHSSALSLLISETERYILSTIGTQWVYAFVPAGRLSQIAQAMGMQLEPWNVLSKLVTPDQPPMKGALDLEPIDMDALREVDSGVIQ